MAAKADQVPDEREQRRRCEHRLRLLGTRHQRPEPGRDQGVQHVPQDEPQPHDRQHPADARRDEIAVGHDQHGRRRHEQHEHLAERDRAEAEHLARQQLPDRDGFDEEFDDAAALLLDDAVDDHRGVEHQHREDEHDRQIGRDEAGGLQELVGLSDHLDGQRLDTEHRRGRPRGSHGVQHLGQGEGLRSLEGTAGAHGEHPGGWWGQDPLAGDDAEVGGLLLQRRHDRGLVCRGDGRERSERRLERLGLGSGEGADHRHPHRLGDHRIIVR
jgi:hypothetical protein